ncbi:MAG: N-acetylmuramoyl-L-alanine amidase [Firmicutes bacterium]|nr:N-acetylmuramoyl-L-alanine amidase [Bacillota bacterium]
MATVVIDAGHGGSDPGAIGPGGRREKDDNLRFALALGNALTACGINVTQTRTTDVFIPLQERANISNRVGADLFVSIHRNGAYTPNANGVEVWIHPQASARAEQLANNVLSRVVAAGVQSNRGVRRANFTVLARTQAPAILFEYGFMTNVRDNQLFDQNFNAYVNATRDGILATLGVPCRPTTPPITPPPVAPPPVTPPPSGCGSLGGAQTTPPWTPAPPASDVRGTIRYIQNALNVRYGQNLAVDGIWGPLSARALVRAYQLELNRQFCAGLAVDGIFGPLTAGATRLVRQGNRGNLVWLLQSALYVRGFHARPDGIFGPITDMQTRNFQRSRGIGVDGIAGPITFGQLFRTTP